MCVSTNNCMSSPFHSSLTHLAKTHAKPHAKPVIKTCPSTEGGYKTITVQSESIEPSAYLQCYCRNVRSFIDYRGREWEGVYRSLTSIPELRGRGETERAPQIKRSKGTQQFGNHRTSLRENKRTYLTYYFRVATRRKK